MLRPAKLGTPVLQTLGTPAPKTEALALFALKLNPLKNIMPNTPSEIERVKREIHQEQEWIAQQVRNWTGGDLVYKNILSRLSVLRNFYERAEANEKAKEAEMKQR